VPISIQSYFQAAIRCTALLEEDKSNAAISEICSLQNLMTAIDRLFQSQSRRHENVNQWESRQRFLDFVLRRMSWQILMKSCQDPHNLLQTFQERLVTNVMISDNMDWKETEVDFTGHRDAINIAILAHKVDSELVGKLLENIMTFAAASLSKEVTTSATSESNKDKEEDISYQHVRRTLCLTTIVAIVRSLGDEKDVKHRLSHDQLQTLTHFLLQHVEKEIYGPAKHHCLVALCILVEKDLLGNEERIEGEEERKASHQLVKDVLHLLLETRVAGKYYFADMTEVQRDEIRPLHQETVIRKLQQRMSQFITHSR
jgi:hypothetical protein